MTAKLSRHFYDTFGDQAVSELVDWMNAVDLSYRSDLLQINEANAARFDATVDARMAEVLRETDRRFAEVDRRFAELHAEMDRRFAELQAEMDRRFAEVRTEMHAGFAAVEIRLTALDARFAKFEARMLKWMLVFWVTTILTLLQLR